MNSAGFSNPLIRDLFDSLYTCEPETFVFHLHTKKKKKEDLISSEIGNKTALANPVELVRARVLARPCCGAWSEDVSD